MVQGDDMTDKQIVVLFSNSGKECTVDAGKDLGNDGEAGSILQIAIENQIDIDHACGGVGACSTCHVIVEQGEEFCEEPSDDELDQLDNAPGLQMDSRLACQCVPTGEGNLIVTIPAWNRNRVPSDH
ncbi:MAG: ferredoxin [Acidobacteria bacterium]|nr:MAG: ferredoxin [Acidobacteriota bacterium]